MFGDVWLNVRKYKINLRNFADGVPDQIWNIIYVHEYFVTLFYTNTILKSYQFWTIYKVWMSVFNSQNIYQLYFTPLVLELLV